MAARSPRGPVMRRWHRTFGVVAAVFVFFMTISGMLINHSNQLGMDRHHVSQPSLLDWYGLESSVQVRSYRAGNRWLSFAGSQVYLDEQAIASLTKPVGAIAVGQLLVVAGMDEILLFDPTGVLVERMTWSQPRATSIESIGRSLDERVVVRSNNQNWTSDPDFLTWQTDKALAAAPDWSSPDQTPEHLRRAISGHYLGSELSLERVLLDLHSGRIFGPLGILFYDLFALATGFLAISGLILWFRNRRNGRRSISRPNSDARN